MSYETKYTKEFLDELRALPLHRKVQLTQNRIIEWYQHFDGKVCISFSGGKDSTVLLHIARSIFPDIKAVFSNTGLEYPEIQAFVMKQPNVEIIRPKMAFPDVISTYGYPLISKEVAEAIYYARRIVPKADAEAEYREREQSQQMDQGACVRRTERGDLETASSTAGEIQGRREWMSGNGHCSEHSRRKLCSIERESQHTSDGDSSSDSLSQFRKKKPGVPTTVFHRRRLCGVHSYIKPETARIAGAERERERVRRNRGSENQEPV